MYSVNRILIQLFTLVIALPSPVRADNDLQTVKLSSCGPAICTRLETEHGFVSTIQPNIMAFGPAHLFLVDSARHRKILRQFDAGEGYYDMRDQVIILRDLKHSVHRELIYDLAQSKFIYF